MSFSGDPLDNVHVTEYVELRAERDRLLAAVRAIASPSGKTVEQAERIAREALGASRV